MTEKSKYDEDAEKKLMIFEYLLVQLGVKIVAVPDYNLDITGDRQQT